MLHSSSIATLKSPSAGTDAGGGLEAITGYCGGCPVQLSLSALSPVFRIRRTDFKDMVPRTAYKGVVTFRQGSTRVHLVPIPGLKLYDYEWED